MIIIIISTFSGSVYLDSPANPRQFHSFFQRIRICLFFRTAIEMSGWNIMSYDGDEPAANKPSSRSDLMTECAPPSIYLEVVFIVDSGRMFVVCSGLPHFTPGPHQASADSDQVVLLSYIHIHFLTYSFTGMMIWSAGVWSLLLSVKIMMMTKRELRKANTILS